MSAGSAPSKIHGGQRMAGEEDLRIDVAVIKKEVEQIKGDVAMIKRAMFFVVGTIISGFILALIAVIATRSA